MASGNTAARDDAVDTILRRDPADVYARMDARSREDYLDRVNAWSARARRPASEVAQTAIDLAFHACQRHGATDRRSHVGYYLANDGVAEFGGAIHAKPNFQERLRLHFTSNLVVYCAVVFLICCLFGFLAVSVFGPELPWFVKAVLVTVAAIYISRIIPGWLTLLVSRSLVAQWMPRLDFSKGIPASARTLVVIPSLLTSREGILKLAQALERLYQSNSGAGAGYAILSDFVDADAEHVAGDERLLDEARAQIDALNERHGGGFVLLHRPRRWNAAEGRWIGWERKRGKLEELNAFLMDERSPFDVMHGDLDKVAGIRYVLTLDDDNADLTPGGVHQLAGALAHPLHRPVLSGDGRRVVNGHALLQPRVTISLPLNGTPTRLENFFNWMFEFETSEEYRSAEPIIDADQDLFGQTCYYGKGIYDVAVFHRLTRGLIAENTVLTHDALEGGLVRSATVTDLLLHETFPPTFHNSMTRTHRWQRGDWQLIPWLFPTIRDASGQHVRNPLPLFGRWLIFHSAIRILFPVAALLCFIIGWATFSRPGLWTLGLLAIAWTPPLVALLIGTIHGLVTRRGVAMIARGLWAALSLRGATFIFAVDQAQNASDAAIRASFRMLVSRRKLLEWTASVLESNHPDPTLPQYTRMMWLSPALAVATVWLIDRVNPIALTCAIPFAALWFSAPFVAWWWSQKPDKMTCSAQPSQS